MNRPRIDPKSLIPKLPNPQELKPFPTAERISYVGHEGRVRSIAVDPRGQWLVSGADDNTVRLWEVQTGRCITKWDLPDIVHCVAWNPNTSISVVAIITDKALIFLDPGVGNEEQTENTNDLFNIDKEYVVNEKLKSLVVWEKPTPEEWDKGFRLLIEWNLESSTLRFVTWHYKGDYIATVSTRAASKAVLIHQLSKRQTQNPFKKNKGIVQVVRFHPSQPHLFVATQKLVRVYNLANQSLFKKLSTNMQWVSSLDIHPKGDNLIVGSYDKKACWFDMDLSTSPYKIIRYHELAVRQVKFHKHYPLFATCSDDGTVQVFHGMVYNDLLQNALIVPLKILRGHKISNQLGVLDIEFHPTQHWIFSAGADKTIRLYT